MASWIKKRQQQQSGGSEDRKIFNGNNVISPEEDIKMSNLDQVWDLNPKNGRFIRLGVKRFDIKLYVYLKIFKFLPVREESTDNLTEKWVR